MTRSSVHAVAAALVWCVLILAYGEASAAGDVRQQIRQARRLEAMGHSGQALTIYREVYEADPENKDASAGIRSVLSQMQRYDELAAFLREEFARHPESVLLVHELGEALYNAGRREEAALEWNRALQAVSQIPDGDEYLFQYGEQWERRGLYEVAGNAYRTLIARHGGSRRAPGAMLRLGGCEERMMRYAQALSTYERLIEAFPRRAEAREALYRTGRVQLDALRDVDAALDAFRRVSAVPGGRWRTDALLGLAACQVIRDELSDADKTYSTVSRERRGSEYDERASFERGRLAYYEGDFERAIQHIEATVARFPEGALTNDALSLLLMIEEHQGRCEEELRIYAHAQLRRRQWRAGEAVAALERLVTGVPSSDMADDALMLLGTLRADSQDDLGALRTYELLVSSYPSSGLCPPVRIEMAKLYERMGQLERAAEAYETFLVEYPEDVRAGEVRMGLRAIGRRIEERKALKETG